MTTTKACGANKKSLVLFSVCLFFFVSLYPFLYLHKLQHINDSIYTTIINKSFIQHSNNLQSPTQLVIDDRHGEEFALKETTNEEKEGSLFVPGSLNLTRLESIRRCYVDPKKYQHHFGKKQKRDEVSESHNLVYVQQAKAGSSSARHIMHRLFGDVEFKIFQPKRAERDRYHRFTFTRDPISRFLSAFHEALITWNRNSHVPKEGKFDFLEEFFSLSRKQRSHAVQFDLDRISQMLEDFVRDYDGKNVPDDHLRLQVPNLMPKQQKQWDEELLIPDLDAIYDIENMEEEFTNMWMASLAYNITTKNKKVGEHAYKRYKHLNISLISLDTRKKICQLSALDFCCLNYMLPSECEGVLSCQWIRNPQAQSMLSGLAIAPVSPYPSL